MSSELKIVEDDGNKIVYQEISTNIVDRLEVAAIEQAIAELEKELVEKNEKLEALKEKIKFANEVIAVADAKQNEQEQESFDEEATCENVIDEVSK